MEINLNISTIFLDMQAVVMAKISSVGKLIEANVGFYNLLPFSPNHGNNVNVSDCFIQPSFNFLTTKTSDKTQIRYKGIFTIGNRASKTWTLEGTFYKDGDNWFIMAEHNIQEIESMRLLLSDLNRDLAQKQRELVRINRELMREKELVAQLSLTDPLTGLGNRRKLEENLNIEIIRTHREQGECGLIMCDIDHFKAINDDFGHDIGDIVLTEFAKLIIHCIRPSDLAIRYGGEEFIILMPGASVENTSQSAERLRKALSELQFEQIPRTITASFGVSELVTDDTPERFIKRADTAMYQAKNTGRNQVVTIAFVNNLV